MAGVPTGYDQHLVAVEGDGISHHQMTETNELSTLISSASSHPNAVVASSTPLQPDPSIAINNTTATNCQDSSIDSLDKFQTNLNNSEQSESSTMLDSISALLQADQFLNSRKATKVMTTNAAATTALQSGNKQQPHIIRHQPSIQSLQIASPTSSHRPKTNVTQTSVISTVRPTLNPTVSVMSSSKAMTIASNSASGVAPVLLSAVDCSSSNSSLEDAGQNANNGKGSGSVIM